MPVLWKGMTPTLRVPRAVALLTLPALAFVIGVWLKIESRALTLDLAGATITLGVRVALAPLFALLQIGRVQKALAGSGVVASIASLLAFAIAATRLPQAGGARHG